MRKLNRLTMTLALLIMAVGGAWAQSTLDVVELEVPADWENNTSNVTAGDLPGFKASTLAEVQAWTGAPAMAMVIYAFNGDVASYVSILNGKADNGTNHTISKAGIFNSKSAIKIYYTGKLEITEWELKPDDTGKNWILDKMPASDVELQVEYFAESNLFLSKDALADKGSISVKAGDLGLQFGDDGKSANTVTEGTAMTVTYNGTKKLLGMKVEKKADNAYLKWNADQKKLVETEIPTTATKVENSNENVSWQAGTYVVDGEVNISGTITLSGDVNLIIKDGAKLTAQRISGNSKNLSIYGQAQMTGELVVNSSTNDAITSITTLEVHSAKVTSSSSGNDRGGFFYIGTFNVYGGLVDAKNTAEDGGYGIGMKAGGFMNIYGGEVKAEGKGDNAKSNGIHGGDPVNKATVTVYGGKLWAGNADDKALRYVTLTIDKSLGFNGEIQCSPDNSTWHETVGTPDEKYVRVGY